MTAHVCADIRSVVDWYLDPVQKEAVIAEMEELGRTNYSVDDTFTDSVRIRDIRWSTPMGESMYQTIETELGPDGRPGSWIGERFRVVGHEVNRSTYSATREDVVDCNYTMEFVPDGDNATKIISTHHHLNVDSRWYERLLPPIAARAAMQRNMRRRALRCEQALRTPGDALDQTD
jgi:hypothetical protein